MNKVMLMGRLTRDPEVRYTQSATPTAVARYGLAVKRRYTKQGEPDVDFFNIVGFGKSGEFAEKYFKKGMQVVIIGRLQVNTWEDQQKVKHTSVDIVVEEQHFAEGKKDSTPNNAPGPMDSVPEGHIPPSWDTDDEELPF